MSQFPPAPQPLYIRGRDEPIFAFLHSPDRRASDTAILLCPPFGWEDMCSYRSRREWACSLATAGFPTLRIDFPGSGDSGGGPRDRKRVEAWTNALWSSAQWLSSKTGARKVLAVGIGLGGVIAYRALALGAPIDDLVLWGVSSRGQRHVREMRAFSYLEVDQPVAGTATTPVTRENSDGSLVVAGYLISAETQQELDELDLTKLDSSRLASSRVLMLGRDDRAVDGRLRSVIERSGAELTVAQGEGFAAMMTVELPHAVPAYTVFDTVRSWLAEGSSPAEDASGGRPSLSSPAPLRSSPEPQSEALDAVEIVMPGGERLRETPISIPDTFGALFGILTEPIGPTGDLCAVWLNAGPQRRTGPNRMWVETARRWAAKGVPTFRVDLAGIGDAEGDSDSLVDVRSYFVADYLEQVRLVLDTLQARGLPDRFLLGGLCAGGYWGLQAAQNDSRISAVAALNPAYIVYDGGLTKAVDNAHTLMLRMLRLSTWRRILRGQASPSVHLLTLKTLLGGLKRALLRTFSRLTSAGAQGAGARNEVEQAFDRLKDHNQRVLLMFAGDEWPYIQLMRSGSLKGLERWPNISVEHIAVAGNMHTLRPLSLQRQTHKLIDELLHQELQLADGGSRPNHQLIAAEH